MDDALRVLLVDDEEDYLRTAAKIFRRKGIDAEVCSVGRDVPALLEEKQCQVVVLDLKMPGMGGLEVLREIKARQPLVQVIILTGHASSDDAAVCLTSGAFDFLSPQGRGRGFDGHGRPRRQSGALLSAIFLNGFASLS